VDFTASAVTVRVGATHQLAWRFTPANPTNRNVTFSSSNTNVATVSPAGLVTARNVGSATITITTHCQLATQNFTDTITITVQPAELRMGATPAATVRVGQTIDLYVFDVSAGQRVPNANIGWSTANANIANVNQSGRVRGESVGSVVITATLNHGGQSRTVTTTIRVNP